MHKDKIKEYQKKYRENNKDILEEYIKEYRDNNKEAIKEAVKIYYKDNKEIIKEYKKEYYQNNKEAIKENNKEYQKNKIKNDISFKLRRGISTSIYKALKLKSSSKKYESCLKYLNYNIEQLKFHIEKQFEPWMSWENWGIYKINEWNDNDQSTWVWNLDHIIPHSIFKYTSMEDENFKKCWSLENLRPYSAKQNLIDGANRISHNKK